MAGLGHGKMAWARPSRGKDGAARASSAKSGLLIGGYLISHEWIGAYSNERTFIYFIYVVLVYGTNPVNENEMGRCLTVWSVQATGMITGFAANMAACSSGSLGACQRAGRSPAKLTGQEGSKARRDCPPGVRLVYLVGKQLNSAARRLRLISGSTGKPRSHFVNWASMRPAAILAQ